MVLKRSSKIKLRHIVNRNYQRFYTNKTKCTSPTPDFYVLNYVYTIAPKEDNDITIIDLHSFFLQIEAKEGDNRIMKLTSVVVLLLIKCNTCGGSIYAIRIGSKKVC